MQTATAQDIGPPWPCSAAVSRMWVNDPAPAITASTVTGSASATASRRRPALTSRPAVLARPGRPGGPSPARSGLARLPLCPSGAAPVNAESFTPGCLLNARPALTLPAATVPPATRGRAPGGPGRNSPPSTEIGFLRLFFTCWPEIRYQRGKIGRLLQEFRCTWLVPFLVLSCTCDIPGAAFPPVPALARRWSADRRFSRAARAWRTRGHLGLCPRARFLPLPGGRAGARRASGPAAGVQRLGLRDPERRHGGREQRRQRPARARRPPAR